MMNNDWLKEKQLEKKLKVNIEKAMRNVNKQIKLANKSGFAVEIDGTLNVSTNESPMFSTGSFNSVVLTKNS